MASTLLPLASARTVSGGTVNDSMGGGFVGIHSAADTEYEWRWYGRLVGGYFLDHPGINDPHPNVQPGILTPADSAHPSVGFLPEKWKHTDEWYSYRDVQENLNILLLLDEESYQGGEAMGEHPVAWYQEYDGGRAFYTGLGHTNEAYSDDFFLQHLLGGQAVGIRNGDHPVWIHQGVIPVVVALL